MTLTDAALLQIRSYNKVRDIVQSVVGKYNLNLAQWRMLAIIDKFRKVTPSTLAKELSVGKSYIVEATAQLIEDGLIAIEVNAVDKRSKNITLTPTAFEVVIAINHQLKEELAELMKDVTPDEVAGYISVLSKIAIA